MRPIKARSRRPMTVVVSIASMSCARLGGVEHRRLATPHDMARPAHGGGRVGRHDLVDNHPIEQVTQGGQAQLRRRRGPRSAQLLDVGRDVHALDRGELRDAARLKPIEEFRRGARIGAARVRVSDLRGEEFEEAIRGARAGGDDKGRGAREDDGGELVHWGSRAFRILTQRIRAPVVSVRSPRSTTAKPWRR